MQLTLFDPEADRLAAAIKRQKAIALHYCQVAIDRDRLEAEAVQKLQDKDNSAIN
jgi:hypothetical protein